MNFETILSVTGVMCKGIGITLSLFAVTILLSIPLGLCCTFLVTGKNRVLAAITRGYVLVMRGTPLMLQLFFFYYGLVFLPGIGPYLAMGRFTAACVTFVLNYAAYFCEIFRGGFLSIDRGQYEAAKVLGLRKWQTTIRIVLPQMFKVTLPAVTNETITLVKDTALVTAIGLTDLLHYTKSMVNHYVNVTPYVIAALLYLMVTVALTRLFRALEKKVMF